MKKTCIFVFVNSPQRFSTETQSHAKFTSESHKYSLTSQNLQQRPRRIWGQAQDRTHTFFQSIAEQFKFVKTLIIIIVVETRQ